MKEFNLFSSLVIEFDLRNFIDKNIIFKVINEYNNVSLHGLVHKGYSSINKKNILDNPSLYNLKQEFQTCILKYCQQLLIKEPRITNSWFNIMENQGKVDFHIHEGSTLSGAYYPLLQEGTCDLVFQNPLHGSIINLIPLENKQYTIPLKHYIMPIKEDHLYIFPSYLQHGTTTNTGNDRVVISFNTKF